MTESGLAALVVASVYLAVATIAAVDAHRRGQSGLKVGALVAIAPLIGVVWWVAIRSRYPVGRPPIDRS